jgi:diguanylate cyclase (GGDEF)-like protein
LNAALNNMAQGLCFFDKAQRLIVRNDLYCEMYGLDPLQVRSGMTLREIIELREAAGSAPDMSKDQYHAWRNTLLASDQSSDTVVKLKNGKIFQIKHRTMPDGGWVATHEDVTERRQTAMALECANHELAERNSLLARREQELKEQNARFDVAINNMSQGLCMFDRDQRVVVCNDRYAQMYDLTPERVKLGTPLRELIEDRISRGIYAGASSDEYLREKLAPVLRDRDEIVELSDGRILRLTARVMQDGGFVTTQEDITDRHQIEARIAHLAHHDGLTDLANRLLFQERLKQAMLRAQRKVTSVALLYLDLDRFKEINDTLGHAVGDLVLKAVAERLHKCTRKNDLVARLGGDEFAIVLESGDATKDAAALAARVINCLAEPHLIDGRQLIVGTTIGIAVASGEGDDPDQLVKNADLALYRAKNDERGSFCFFERDMDTRMRARRAMEVDLKTALEVGQLELNYQPLLNLTTNRISSCEALLRWNHPVRGWVSPADFIPTAEATGLIAPIGEWVLREACREAANWPTDIKIAVNLSPLQFKVGNILLAVVSALAASGLSASRLELEITESVLIADNDAARDILTQLHAMGVGIALDDFGTGYSSLSYLRSFPFNKIKIDRCFISDLGGEDKSALTILRMVTQLGRALGMTVTAEGVETAEQLEIVRGEKCTEMQGYLLSRPVAASEIRLLLSSGPKHLTEAA